VTSTAYSTGTSSATPPSPTRRILTALREADAEIVAKRPWLSRDDAVAMGLFVLAAGVITACVAAWSVGTLPTVVAIFGIAMGLSVFHELEHDLIHDLYLANPVVRVGVLTTIWFGKASIDPWTRGRWHRWHHTVSGQEEDIEERLIGMGQPWGPLRVLITLLPVTAIVLKPRIRRAVLKRAAETGRRPNLDGPPGSWLLLVVTAFLVTLPFVAVGGLLAQTEWAWPLLILWVLPNTIRHSAIVIMSSNSHYTEIKRGSVLEQNQILDHPMFWPLQIFCWNFGATHVVHHFLVRQPFWRRTLIFGSVRQVLVDHGVPANDLQTFRRANRRLR
jgi:hypothetical protein